MHRDIFGLYRTQCIRCGLSCSGYAPSYALFPKVLSFPTFCKGCHCPAYFHKVLVGNFSFPDKLLHTLKNYKLTLRDLNFNAVVVCFEIIDE